MRLTIAVGKSNVIIRVRLAHLADQEEGIAIDVEIQVAVPSFRDDGKGASGIPMDAVSRSRGSVKWRSAIPVERISLALPQDTVSALRKTQRQSNS